MVVLKMLLIKKSKQRIALIYYKWKSNLFEWDEQDKQKPLFSLWSLKQNKLQKLKKLKEMLLRPKTIHKLFATNSSSHVKWRFDGKV